jgi:muconate cycloisomerase
MKIVLVQAIPVNLPFKNYISDSWGKYYSSNHGIVILTGEDGTTGLGEISFAWYGGAHGLCREVNDNWASHIVGLEHTQINRLNEILSRLCTFSKRNLLAKAGIEMAAWDLLGKSQGLPVHALLGGKLRDSIPLTGGIRMAGPAEMAEEARLRVEEGYLELKLKVGLDDARDLEGARAVRKAIPDHIKLRADANMAWRTPKHAKAMIDELQQLGVHIIEQPLDERNLEGLRWLRENTRSLMLLDESVWDANDAHEVITASAADMLHVYVSEAGGLDEARRIFHLAAAARMECTVGSMPEGVIGASASLHLAAAMGNLSAYPSDIRGHIAYAEDVTQYGLPVVSGAIKVPDTPGLGVELDPEKLDSLRVDKG